MTCIDVLKNVYEDDSDFLELIVEIDRFRRLVKSIDTTFDHNLNAMMFCNG